MIIAYKCTGDGQGSCKRCEDNGKWNRAWMCFLYHIDGLNGCYCGDCVRAIAAERNEQYEFRNDMS